MIRACWVLAAILAVGCGKKDEGAKQGPPVVAAADAAAKGPGMPPPGKPITDAELVKLHHRVEEAKPPVAALRPGLPPAQKEGDAQLTKTGYVIGSPKYMAPEQILGKQVDPRADIYSTGVILYEMLTGVPPYSRGDHMAVMYQHVQGKAKAPIEVNKALPQGLSDLVAKAMAVEKTKRYQSMEELKAALEKYT